MPNLAYIMILINVDIFLTVLLLRHLLHSNSEKKKKVTLPSYCLKKRGDFLLAPYHP